MSFGVEHNNFDASIEIFVSDDDSVGGEAISDVIDKHMKLNGLKNIGRRFANESDKTWHEMGCENRLYECYLCKVYVSTEKARMQNHLRTHSGAKPFYCAACGKCFGSKTYLTRHISFHDRKK